MHDPATSPECAEAAEFIRRTLSEVSELSAVLTLRNSHALNHVIMAALTHGTDLPTLVETAFILGATAERERTYHEVSERLLDQVRNATD